MPDTDALKDELAAAATLCAQAAQKALGAAAVTAGIEAAPDGREVNVNLNDAAALSSTATNAASAAREFTQSLINLEQAFPAAPPAPDPPPEP